MISSYQNTYRFALNPAQNIKNRDIILSYNITIPANSSVNINTGVLYNSTTTSFNTSNYNYYVLGVNFTPLRIKINNTTNPEEVYGDSKSNFAYISYSNNSNYAVNCRVEIIADANKTTTTTEYAAYSYYIYPND